MSKRLSPKAIVAGILVVMVLYLMMSSAVFATDVTVEDYNGVKIAGAGSGTVIGLSASATSFTIEANVGGTDKNPTAGSYTVTFTSSNAGDTVLEFDYTVPSVGSLNLNGTDVTSNGSESVTLTQASPTYTITLISGSSSGANASVTISKFGIVRESTNTIKLVRPEYGSYTVSSTNGDPAVTMTPDYPTEEQDYTYVSTAGITLTWSVPASGYKFDRWDNLTSGQYLSYENGITVSTGIGNGDRLIASFVPTALERAFTVGLERYYSWEEAMDAAVSTGNPMVLNTNYTLPATRAAAELIGERLPDTHTGVSYVQVTSAGNMKYIVPGGVTFAIPYESTLSVENLYKTTGSPANGTAAYTLTVNAGTEIEVQSGGTFLINAKRLSGTEGAAIYQHVITGNYGRLVMGGTMTLKSGALLDARGYVVDTDHKTHSYGSGTGRIIALDGSVVKVPFQIFDHRGGLAAFKVISSLMPMTSYSINNIMVYTEYNYGSVLKATYDIYVPTTKTHYDGEFTLLDKAGTSDVLFTMSSGGVITMDYEYATDRMIVAGQKGNVVMQNIVITLLKYVYEIDTAKVVLPLPDNMQLYIGDPNGAYSDSGVTVDITYPVKLLPGAALHVMENGTLNVTANSGLYLYAHNTTDYDPTWGNSRYRSTMFGAENLKGKHAVIGVSEDAAIYVAGTLNAQGPILQSGAAADTAAKANRILPTAETAVLNLSKIAEDGSVTVNETAGTGGSVTGNTNWNKIDGIFAGSTDYTDFAATGTYKVVRQDSQNKWYNYTVTYKFRDAAGNEITGLLSDSQNPGYVVGDSTTFAASSLSGGYVITGFSASNAAVTAAPGASDPNKDKSIDYGWENLTLSGITQDTEVTLTLAPYVHRVAWSVTESSTTSSWTEYLSGTSTSYSWEGSARVVAAVTPAASAAKCEVVLADDDPATADKDETTTTLNVTDVDLDISLAVTVDKDYWRVIWNVTYPGSSAPVQKTEWVKKGESAAYTVEQPDSGWYLVEDGSYAVTNNAGTNIADTVGVINEKTVLTLSSVTCATNVDVTLTEYAYCVGFTVLSNTDEMLTIKPVYVKEDGGSVTVKNTAAQGAVNYKYVFQKDSASIAAGDASASAAYTDLTVSNVKADSTVQVSMNRYDYTVTIQSLDGTPILNEYVTADTVVPVTYTFGDGVKIDSVSDVTTATVTHTKAVVDPADNTKTVPATVSVSSVKSNTTVTVSTSAFKHIVTIQDQNGASLYAGYVNSDDLSYTCQNNAQGRYIATAAAVTSGTGTANVDCSAKETVKITGMTGNPTIVLTMDAYTYKVIWSVNNGQDVVTSTDYLTGGRTTSAYDAPDRYIITHRTVSINGSGVPTYAVDTMKQIQYSPVNTDMTVNVTLTSYDYEVAINDGEAVTYFYVDKDEPDVEITYGDPIRYDAADGKYIKAYNQTGTAQLDYSDNTNADVNIGWETIKVTGVGSDVTVDLTLGTYDHRVKWIVNTMVDGNRQQVIQQNYVTGSTDSWKVSDDVTILDAVPSVSTVTKTISDDCHMVTVKNIDKDVTVTVNAQNCVFNIDWVITKDGQTQKISQAVQKSDIVGDAVALSTAGYSIDKDYVVGNVWGNDFEVVEKTNKVLTIKRTDNSNLITVNVAIDVAETNYAALWGDMNFRYYKNGAYYGWNGETYTWELIDTYAWMHKPGGRAEKYADVDPENAGEEKSYFIPNGSVLLVNPTNQIISATVSITWNVDWGLVTTLTSDGVSTETGSITVIVQPHETALISGEVSGDPPADQKETMDKKDIAQWSVDIQPTN